MAALNLPLDVRARHIFLIGATGQGKSGLMESMLYDDINAGHGVGFLDPHGTSAAKVVTYIPEWRKRDLIYINAADKDRPVSFNPLSDISKGHAVAADNILSAFIHVFGEDAIGPRSQQVLRNSLRALFDTEAPSLLAIPKLLTDREFRLKVIKDITDPVVMDYWTKQFEKYDDRKRDDVVGPILNKLDAFLSSPDIRNIISQPSSFSLPKVLNDGQILVANLSKAELGEQSSHLLGALLVTAIAQAAFEKTDDRPFYLYVDEFANFASDGFDLIFSEARKTGLSITVANQYLDQLPPKLRSSVFGNVGAVVAFRVGAQDAPILAQHLGWKNAEELSDRQQYHCRVRVFPNDSFEMKTPEPPRATLSDVAVLNSRNNYGRERVKVERKIKSFLDASASPRTYDAHGTVLRKVRAGSRPRARQSRA